MTAGGDFQVWGYSFRILIFTQEKPFGSKLDICGLLLNESSFLVLFVSRDFLRAAAAAA
jgi:hypothetical protein